MSGLARIESKSMNIQNILKSNKWFSFQTMGLRLLGVGKLWIADYCHGFMVRWLWKEHTKTAYTHHQTMHRKLLLSFLYESDTFCRWSTRPSPCTSAYFSINLHFNYPTFGNSIPKMIVGVFATNTRYGNYLTDRLWHLQFTTPYSALARRAQTFVSDFALLFMFYCIFLNQIYKRYSMQVTTQNFLKTCEVAL